MHSKLQITKTLSLLTAAAVVSVGVHLEAQVTPVPSTYVLPSTAADTIKPGFIWRMSQVASVGTYVQNSTARAEAQLAGLLGDNLADPSVAGVALAPASPPSPASAPIQFEIATVINVDRNGGSSGNFTPDDQMPGSPGTAGGTDNQAAEVLTWLDLPAGDITMGVNSDDGFRLTIGGGSPQDKISAVQVGIYEGGRGAGDSIFTFHIDKAGLYAARLVWYNGGSDSRVEWFSEKADQSKVLINDIANGCIKAYRAVTTAGGSYVGTVSPVVNATGVAPDTSISAQILDGAKAVDPATVSMSIDGQKVAAQVSKTGSTTTVSFTPTSLFASLTTHTVSLTFTDDTPKTAQWSFTIGFVGNVPASLAVTPDTTKPGFIFRVSHVGTIPSWRNSITGNTDINTSERADAQLAGLLLADDGTRLPNLADPNAKGPALAAASAPNPAYAPLSFEIPTVINLNEASGGSAGNFPNDDQMPGAPGTDSATDNFAAEIITYLDLPAGLLTMGVASDDGFRVQLGNDALTAATLASFETGRAVAETTFSFVVQQAGVYPFRLTWENGTGDASVEWYTIQGGNRVLINGTGSNAIKAYRALSGATPARVTSATPLPIMRGLNQQSHSLNVLVADGSSPIDANSVTLTLDGQTVSPTVAREGSSVRITYTPSVLEIPGNVHTAALSFKDGTGTAITRTWEFRSLKNVVLPDPVAMENFDSTAEGSVPTGWVAVNYTDCSGDYCTTPGLNLDDLNSDTYKGWVVVSKDRLNGLKGSIFAAVAPGETFNGQPVTTMGDGNVLYAESDVRDGSQVQFITTKPFDLSKVTNAVVSFQCFYTQNQDNIGAVEYSVDGGTNWLPVVYFIDTTDSGGDIKVNPDGSVDAVRTLNDPNPDTGTWTDPVTKQAKGGTYGAFIAAPISPALAPYIAGRVNDDQVEAKRVEVFRLWQADQKPDVRLRFAQGGTASWYFGIDNLAFYDAAAPGTDPSATAPSNSGGPAELGQTVNGFQDDFTAATRDPNWVPVGPGGDRYVQTNGVLQVSTSHLDPNHLLYMGPGASNSVQEVLARIRVVAFGTSNDQSRGGIAVGVMTNNPSHTNDWIGANINFRNNADVSGAPNVHVRMLDDLRAWGPQYNIAWTNNVWYWMRLRVAPQADGTNDYFGKIWPADGATPEPNNWQMLWPDKGTGAAPAPLHTGYAGITGCSGTAGPPVVDGLGQLEVDYILIKAATLPSITVNFAPQGPPSTPPELYGIFTVSTNKVAVDWFGGVLQSAAAVTGPWTTANNAPSPNTNTVSAATPAKFFRIKQ